MPEPDIFQRVQAAADAAALDFLLIGGHAVNAHGYTRTTLDVDFLVKKVHREEWKRLLLGWGYHLIHELDAFAQFDPPTPLEMELDLMFVDDATFAKLHAGSSLISVGGATLPVAGVLHLIALKLHALKTPSRVIAGKDYYDVVNLVRLHQIAETNPDFLEILNRYASSYTKSRLLRECFRSVVDL